MPNKQLWIKIWIQIKNSLKFAAVFLIDKNPITKARLKAFCAYVRRSWKSIAVILPLVLLLYYTIGGYVTNTIDKNISFESKVYDRGLNVVGIGADLIKREVDDNMWTPNLPFIFPGYVLDNMPAFQTGVIQSVASSANIMSKIFDNEELKKANELLKYPPNIWILSKSDDLALAPSSGAQYRKARNALLKFNKELVGKIVPVLFENKGRHHGQLIGRTPYMQNLHAEADKKFLNRIANVKIESATMNSLSGKIVGE